MAGASKKKKAKRGGTRAKAPARVRPAVSRTKRPSAKSPAKKRASTPRTPAKKSPKKSTPRSPAKKKLPKKAHRSPVKHRAQSKAAPAKKKLPKKSHRSAAKQTKRGHQEHLAQRRQRAADRRREVAEAKTAATAKRRAAAIKGWKAHRARQHAAYAHLTNASAQYKRDGESSSYESFRFWKRQLFETNELDTSNPNYLPADIIEDILIQAALDAGWDELHAARFAKDS